MKQYMFRIKRDGIRTPVGIFMLRLSRQLPGLHLKHSEQIGAKDNDNTQFVIAAPDLLGFEDIKQAMRDLVESESQFCELKSVPETLTFLPRRAS